MFKVPALPYSSPRAVRNNDEAIRLSVTYLKARLDLVACAMHRDQYERGDQHDFEPNIKVKQIACQKCPGYAHEQNV